MQRIIHHIKENQFQNIYLLYGDERYLKRQYTEKLRAALAGDDEMNTHFYEGKGIPVGEIIDLAETMPFLAERRVIFINDSGLFSSAGEKLAAYLEDCNETTFFVFTESDVDARSKLFKTVQSKGIAVEFGAQDENTLKRWVASTLAKEGKRITENNAQLFLSKTGTDMENIQTELEKLISYCLDSDVITAEDIETICTPQITNHIYAMIDAISVKDTQKALELYYELIALREAPMRILFLIARQCNILLQVKELKHRGFGNQDIAKKVEIPPYFVNKYISQASRFKVSQLNNAVRQCVEAEEAVKTGRLGDVISVELLILSVL